MIYLITQVKKMVSPKPGAQEVLSACVIIVITSQQGKG